MVVFTSGPVSKYVAPEDIVVETKTDIIKIDPILVKSINKINQTIIPVFLFDSTQLIYGVVIDTTRIVY